VELETRLHPRLLSAAKLKLRTSKWPISTTESGRTVSPNWPTKSTRLCTCGPNYLRSDHYAPLIRDQLPQSVDWEKKGRRCDWLGVVAPHEQLSTEGCSTFKKKKNGDRAKPCNATHTLPLASNQNQLSGYCMGRDMQKHSEKKNQACDADNRIVAIRFESS
jgi:hypothetical protein